ncbi:hypothetical protein BJP25_20695 [Actinokineospora bangkokensis]|uniref:AB hydrolase-1 domain-containing protein n=1 Tax=Actinokineospora bangkokensis TaxID=1193682 RepID=A0A1Q9LKB5_9PSEU|nr:hypothetical protein BJP25_20695 [Actinokineospora bangkokensis]
MTSLDVRVGDRVVRAHDSGEQGRAVVLWHHGTPQTGFPIEPVARAARATGVRVLSYGRPGYGGSTRQPGRQVVSAAVDAAAVADAFGVDRFCVVGASGGGSHALGCAAGLGDRVFAAVAFAAPAPWSDAFDWYGGMVAPQALRAGRSGLAAREAVTPEFDPDSFVEADYELLAGPWGEMGRDAQRAGREGGGGEVDDDVAFAGDWGVDFAAVRTPVLLVQGGLDRVVPPDHGRHLAALLPHAELWYRPDDGHVSILRELPEALEWALRHLA